MLEKMKEYKQWICWGNKDGRKVPLDPKTLRTASTTSPKTWASYEYASEVASQAQSGVEGLGFVFTENDPFVGVDVDKCIDQDGNYNEVAQDILRRMADTYAEFSPSGNGFHILVKASLPDWAHNKNDQHGVEAYSKKRFFTMSFDQVPDTPDDVQEGQDALQVVCANYLMKQKSKKRASQHQDSNVPILTEGERDNGLFEIARSLFHKGLSKKNYQAYKLNPDNVVLLTPYEHQLFDQGTQELRERYAKDVGCDWEKLYNYRIRLLEEYNKLIRW